MLEKNEPRDVIDLFPKWGCNEEGTSYWIGCELPWFYQVHVEKICQCEKLQKMIMEKCRVILNSGQFDIDWVELKFWSQGLIIDVPGENSCCVYPTSSGYTSHNVDNPAQCFSLAFFLIVALEEIYSAMNVWEQNPGAGLNLSIANRTVRLERSLESTPYEPWNIRDDIGSRDLAVVFARNRHEAEKKMSMFAEGKDGHFRCLPAPLFLVSKEIPSLLKCFEVGVELAGNFPTFTHRVIAADAAQAEELVREMVEKEPPLTGVKNVAVLDPKGSYIGPMVILPK